MAVETIHPIERTLRIVTRVRSLTDAFAFVWDALDEVTDPRIEISPVWTSDDGFRTAEYQVVVAGEPCRTSD